MVPFCLSFGQAFGHLAPFKKQIEVGTGWGWKWQSREQSGCFLRSWYPYIFQNQIIFYSLYVVSNYVEWCFQMICIFFPVILIVSTILFSDGDVSKVSAPKNTCRSAARTVSRTVAEKYGLWQLQLSIHGIVAWCETP